MPEKPVCYLPDNELFPATVPAQRDAINFSPSAA
jgi:hypothetical protein